MSYLDSGEIWLLLFLAWLLVALGRSLLSTRRRRESDFLADASASSVIDFTLVFPIFTMVVLVLIQLALLVHARLVVTYAAFAAGRSAIVWLVDGEAEALQKAHQAAAIGCLAISPGDSGRVNGLLSAPVVAPLYRHGDDPGSLGRRIARGASKLASARRATRVSIQQHVTGLGPHDPVTVWVEHDFLLTVPFAARFFRDGLQGMGRPFHTLRERFTLTQEGRVQSR